MNAVERLLGPEALARFGDRPAFVFDTEVTSYAALAGRVRGAAEAYARLGVAPGDRVLILLRDSPRYAVAWLGAVWHGAVAIGLNTKLGDADLRYVAEDSGARLLVSEPGLVRDLGIAAADIGAIDAGAGHADAHRGSAERPAFWLYSSGTTGRPKGVMHAHRAVLSSGQAQREALGLAEADRVLTTSKLFFAYALEHGLLGPLSFGGCSILNADWAEPEAVVELVRHESPTAFFSVPSFYRALLGMPSSRLEPFRRVRRFAAAGERLPEPIVSAWRGATGGEIHSIYGMSETYAVSLVTRPGTSTGRHTGRPLAGVDARLELLDGSPVPAGETGELWLRHPALALGYANRPELTHAQFRDGWFCTRDLFSIDGEGYFVHEGRSDELLKVAGQWVKPAEIEQAASAVPGVTDAACVPFADANGLERVALFVCASGNAIAAADAVQAACERQLARHERPKLIRVVPELPRTATGKIQRFRLRELLAHDGAPSA